MISDRSLSATVVASCALWAIGAGLIVIDLVTTVELGELGLWMAAVAAVLSVRRMFWQQAQRSQEVFEMGRDYERSTRDLYSVR